MLWPFDISCCGMFLTVSNVNIHAFIGFWRIDFVRALKTLQKKSVVCFRAKDILISVAAASTDLDQRIIQDPSNRINETYWHRSIDHNIYFNEIFDGKRQIWRFSSSRIPRDCEGWEGCKLLSLTLSDSVGSILHLPDARKTRVTKNPSYRTRQGRSPPNP